MVVREHRASQPEHSRYYVSTFKSLGPWTVGFEDFDLTRGAPVVSLPLTDQLHPPIFPSQEDLYEL